MDVEEIEDLREEIKNNIGAVHNHCPEGCTDEVLDEYGYCEHFVGFTNATVDAKGKNPVGAVIEPVVTNPLTEMRMVNGRHKRKATTVHNGETVKVIPPSTDTVRATDTLVNPEARQFVNGVYHMAKLWVSSRVYRKIGELKKAS